MDQRRAAAALFALAACFACATAAPTASNQTALDLFEAPVEGCYYNFQHYGEGDRIMTNEPCLNCTCHNRMLMCYLRVCPFTKPIGQDCTVEKRADQCCPIVTCPDVPVDLLTSTSTSSPAEYGATGIGKMDKYGCSINGKYFPEGSKVPPTPNKPCEHCYCIHNMTTCVMQECTLHVDGCTPIYHKDVCCPIRYSCDHAEDEIPLLDDMTTTVRPTPGFLLTTTTMMPVTQASQDCVHEDKIFADGALIKTEKACEHCYCMKGDIVCVVQECGTPMENEGKNCTSLPPKQGQCCPDTYICEGDELSTPQIYEETTTTTPPRRFGVEGSGYRNEPDESFTEMPSFGDTEIEGSGEDNLLSTIPSFDSDTPAVTSQIIDRHSTERNTVSSELEMTTHSDAHENKILTTQSSITTSKTNDVNEAIDEEKDLSVITTVVPSEQPVPTTLAEEFVTQKQDVSDISISKSSDEPTTIESIVTSKLNEISEITPEITTKQSILENVDNMTPVDEEFIIATKLPEKTDNIEESFEEPVTTFKPTEDEKLITEQEISATTPKIITLTEQSTHSAVTAGDHETTTLNVQENEILEDNLSARIPGEGDCLLGGITYKNNTVVPSTNKCHSSCKCVSSIIKCDPIVCTPPLEYMENMNDCQPIYDSPDSCCPTYVCSTKETVAPESHSQMSGTETPKPIECVGDECHIIQVSSVPTETPIDHVCGENGCQEKDQSVLPQNDLNECADGNCDSRKEYPISENQACDETNGCQVPVIKPCADENCISQPDVQIDMQNKLNIDNKPCDSGAECQAPAVTPCIDEDCKIDAKLPDNKDKYIPDVVTNKDEENICKDENCRRKEYDETESKQPCSGAECEHRETISPSNLDTTPKGTIQTSKPDQAKLEDFTVSEPQSTIESFVETTVPSIVTSSEIKQTVEETVTIGEVPSTQPSLIDESLISHQTSGSSEVDMMPSSESPLSHADQEDLVTTSVDTTPKYSFETSEETLMQYTTLGAPSERITESATEIVDKIELVSNEDQKDASSKITDYPSIESTTKHMMSSSQNDKESNEDEYLRVTGLTQMEEKTTHSEISGDEITTASSNLLLSSPHEEISPDTTESDTSFTQEMPDSDLSVKPLYDVTKAPDFTYKYPTTVQTDNLSSTLASEIFTKNTDAIAETIAVTTEKSAQEEHDLGSPDVSIITEGLEDATEIFNKVQTTFQPEPHKQSEPDITTPSSFEEKQTDKAIHEQFTEISPTVTTENDKIISKDQTGEEQDISTSSDKLEHQTKIPDTKYTEENEDHTTAFTQYPAGDKTSPLEIEEGSDMLNELHTTLSVSDENHIPVETQETKEPSYEEDQETTTFRIIDATEPLHYTTSKSIENININELEKDTIGTTVNRVDEIDTTPSYNNNNDISKQTTISSLPSSSDRTEFATEKSTEIYTIEDAQPVTDLSQEFDNSVNEQSTGPTSEPEKTYNEQTTTTATDILDKTSDETFTKPLIDLETTDKEQSTEPSNDLSKTSDEVSSKPAIDFEKTGNEQTTELSIESDKTRDDMSTRPSINLDTVGKEVTESMDELDKTIDKLSTTPSIDLEEKEQVTESSNESDKTVEEFSTKSTIDLDNVNKEPATESSNDLEKTESSNELEKTGEEFSTIPTIDLEKIDKEQVTESSNEFDKTGEEFSTNPSINLESVDKEQATESSNDLEKIGEELSTKPSIDLEKIDKEQVTESSNELDATGEDITTKSSIDLDKTVSEQSTETSNELHKIGEHFTKPSIDLDKIVNEQSTETPSGGDEMVQSTDEPTLYGEEIEKDKVSKIDKPNTTIYVEPVIISSTMSSHMSTESSDKDDLSQTHGFEDQELPTTELNVKQTVFDESNESQFTTKLVPEDNKFISTTKPLYESESDLNLITSTIAVNLDQATIASTDSYESQKKVTPSPMSLITSEPHIVPEIVTDNVQTVAISRTNDSEPTTVEATTTGIDLLTTKQIITVSEIVTQSSELFSDIHSEGTTLLPKEETTSKTTAFSHPSLDESIIGAVTEQSGLVGEELTTRSETDTTSLPHTENETEQELPHATEKDTTVMSSTAANILIEKEQSTESQSDVSTSSKTSEFVTDPAKNIDKTTQEPLSMSTVYQEISMSTTDEQSQSISQEEMATPSVMETDIEKVTGPPEIPVTTNNADRLQDEISNGDIGLTKHTESEATTEISSEMQTLPATVKDEPFAPTASDILLPATTIDALSVEDTQTVVPEQFTTKSPLQVVPVENTERVLDDKIEKQELTTESKYEYSETTPYFVELEEHTHQVIQETSVIPIAEITTEEPLGSQSTERGDQSLTDLLSNEQLTEKPTDVAPEDIIPETTQSSQKQASHDVYTTTKSEVGSTSAPQTDTEIQQDKLKPTDNDAESTVSPIHTSSMAQDEEIITSLPLDAKKTTLSDVEITASTEKTHTVMNEEAQKPDILFETKTPDDHTKMTTPHNIHEELTSAKPTSFEEKFPETSPTTSKTITAKPDDQPSDDMSSPDFPPSGGEYGQEPDYAEEEQSIGPGVCRYGGKVYGSTQQIPRDDPCDFCFCFRSDIICLQQSCPPPIHGCREEPIQGFCCPRYECPVSMTTTLNVTTTTTTTTTTLPPHFLPHAYKGAAQRRGCQIKGHAYKVGEVVRASSGPCLHCTCGGDGQMKCDPKACTPEPMLRQMIAAAVSARRR